MTTKAAPAERPSLLRILFVLLVSAALFAGVFYWAQKMVQESRAGASATWSAPYVDVTLTPIFHFEDSVEQPSADVVLGFVVADPADSCEPSWGGYYNLDAAARALDLDRRVVRLRERGGDAVVSFGGALNHELATICTDSQKLATAYRDVIDRYDLTAVDFDIEGASIADTQANARRAAAIVQLQKDHPELEVWLTLPVAPHGLSLEAVALVEDTLNAGVKLAGVNVMTMNYAESRAGMSMRDANQAALMATWQQMQGIFVRTGITKTDVEIWRMIGATPMIGQNDVEADVFSPGDGRALVDFADSVDLGRISYWSANRDVECGAAVDDSRASNTCSGVRQEPREFASIFGTNPGTRRATLPEVANDSRDEGQRSDSLTRDDPRTSPYPIWRKERAYEEGSKVVWQGRVYESKWWTQDDQPDAPVKNVWETPWRYLGPVLESDRVAVRAGIQAQNGARPRWAAEAVFVAGDEVEHDGAAYRAKWWTQGDVPREDPDQPYDHPWEYLGDVLKK